MSNKLFKELHAILQAKLRPQEDKPDETPETTLRALWSTAAGHPLSAAAVEQITLPALLPQQEDLLRQLVQRRVNNVPLAYITHRQSFMGIEFKSDTRALIPRRETEVLGNKVLELSNMIAKKKETVAVMDVCCGSGNLGLAIAKHNPNCQVLASDLSEEAIALTRENIDFLNLSHRVKAEQGNLFSAFSTETYCNSQDLIVCNPPYIQSSKVDKMDKEIASNEPALAFDGGMLGISIIQKLLRESSTYLSANGWLSFEIGAGQGPFILQLVQRTSAFTNCQPITDSSEIIRGIIAQKRIE